MYIMLQNMLMSFIKFYTTFLDYVVYKKVVKVTGDVNLIQTPVGWFSNTKIPEKRVTYMSYLYHNKRYLYISHTKDIKWPPEQVKATTFRVPVKTAYLVDTDDKFIRDVTSTIKMIAGPRGDYHGNSVRISDVFGDNCKLNITDILNTSKVLSKNDTF